MHLAVVAVAVASMTAACVKVNEFSFRDAGELETDDAFVPGEGAVAYRDGDHVVATVPGLYQLRFSNIGYKFPDQLHIGSVGSSTQVLGTGTGACHVERGVGVAIDPATVISGAGMVGMPALQDIKIALAGPPVAKVVLDWSESTTLCGSTQLSGRSIFTFLPDGRISRMDVARMSSSADSRTCECAGSASEWKVWTYWNINEDEIGSIPSGKPSMGITVPAGDPTCLNGTGDSWHLAFNWGPGGGGARELNYIDDQTISVRGSLAISPDEYLGPDVGDLLSTAWVGGAGESCSSLIQKIGPYKDLLQLTVVGQGNVGPSQDGFYGGETGDDSDPGFDTQGRTYEVAPNGTNIPPFAVWLEFGIHASNNYLVLKDGTPMPPAEYREQKIIDGDGAETSASQRVFWFPSGLENTHTIKVEAM